MNITEILNTIYANASEEYQLRIPEATRDNIAEVGTAIMSYRPTMNEFIRALVNRIGMTVVDAKRYNNPLAILKKGSVPFGTVVQDIYTNPSVSAEYDPTGIELLSRVTPDVKVLYHEMNRQNKYKVTISIAQLKQAFLSTTDMEKLISYIISSLYSGDNFDEFILMKNLISAGIKNGHIRKINVPILDSATNTKNIVKAVNATALSMTFPNSTFNGYKLVNTDPDETPAVTWTPFESQVLLVRADFLTDANIELLATSFNMSKADFLQKVIPVDTFGESVECYALLADLAFFKVFDNFTQLNEFDNGEGLYTNYIWHHWQTYSICHFANAVAFCFDLLTVKIGGVEIDTTSVLIDGTKQIVATTNSGDFDVTYGYMNPLTDPLVATVSATGLITGVSAGTAEIFVRAGTQTKIITVTVTAPTGP